MSDIRYPGLRKKIVFSQHREISFKNEWNKEKKNSQDFGNLYMIIELNVSCDLSDYTHITIKFEKKNFDRITKISKCRLIKTLWTSG